MTEENGKMTNGMLDYDSLLQVFRPRPIANQAAYDATVAQINQLIDKGNLTVDEQDLLTLLGTLVMAYEDEYYPDAQFELRGVALLRTMMTEAGLTEDDLLPVFKTKAAVIAALDEEQPLYAEQANRLAAFFDLPSTLFVELSEVNPQVTV